LTFNSFVIWEGAETLWLEVQNYAAVVQELESNAPALESPA